MSGANLCFYSARCRYSQSFLEELSRTPFAREFRFICVDAPPGGTRPALPPYVRAVPTLMIAGEHEPRIDSAVMNWLTERRLRERAEGTPAPLGGIGAPRPPVGGAGAGAGAGASGPPVGGGPMTDMTGGGGGGLAGFYGSGDFAVGGDEMYSFLTDNTQPSDKTMVRMTGNMAGLSDYGSLAMPDSRVGGGVASYAGAGAGAGAAQMSAKERAANEAFEALKAARDRDLPGPPTRR